jgi:hypothetical protein
MTEENAKVAKKVWMELAKERGHLDAACEEDQVKQEATG